MMGEYPVVLRDDWREQLCYLYEAGYLYKDIYDHLWLQYIEQDKRVITTSYAPPDNTTKSPRHKCFRPATKKEILRAKIIG